MIYNLYAITRITSRKIQIAEFSDLNFLKELLDNFETSDTIQKFIITSKDINNMEKLVYEKELNFSNIERISSYGK